MALSKIKFNRSVFLIRLQELFICKKQVILVTGLQIFLLIKRVNYQ